MSAVVIDTTTSQGFKEAREALDLTVRDLAHVLGMSVNGEKTIRKWERSGGYGPNPVASTALDWFLDGFRPDSWPEEV